MLDNAIKALGISDVEITPETRKMLQIAKGIDYLFGEFLSIYIEKFPDCVQTEGKIYESHNALQKIMWEMSIQAMQDNNVDIQHVAL